ncbi:YcxB family protein [Diaphorobacter aerolatus]|uniref:YcxB family protein n=1 Tax=Diaphorobacter aerolatus TaxID=1288495 RepID=A0A7H0GFR8_9BURK|nr:YcxB family protein [Diaphorobacter aerolatus]QNP47134.1 YcxB family protein [Diaphorobacter aerolatus]
MPQVFKAFFGAFLARQKGTAPPGAIPASSLTKQSPENDTSKGKCRAHLFPTGLRQLYERRNAASPTAGIQNAFFVPFWQDKKGKNATLHNQKMPASIQYKISESDYLAAARLYRKRASGWARALKGFLILAGVAITAFGVYRHLTGVMVAGLVYAAMPWWLQKLINEPLTRRQYRRYPAMQEQQTLSLDEAETGVTMQSMIGETRLTWEHLIRWAEDDDFILLYVQPSMYFIVPKRADPGNAVIGPLREALQRHFGDQGNKARTTTIHKK